MTDNEILTYLKEHNFRIKASDGVNLINSSQQIMDEYYDFQNKIMTITTPNNTFVFKWVLGDGK